MAVDVEEETRPAHMLAGKRTGRAVMRNGCDANRPRCREQDSGDISVREIANAGSSQMVLSLTAARALAQRRHALVGANLVRMERAATKHRLCDGDLDWDTFLDETPECCQTMTINEALRALPYIAKQRAKAMIEDIPGITVRTTMAALSCRHKYALSRVVRVFYAQNPTRRPRRA